VRSSLFVAPFVRRAMSVQQIAPGIPAAALAAGAALPFPPRPPASPPSPPAAPFFGYTAYHEPRLPWRSALDECVRRGGTLAKAATPADSDLLLQSVDGAWRSSVPTGDSVRFVVHDEYWIGGTDQVQEADWRWVADGSKMAWFNWADAARINGPRASKQHCLMLARGFAGGWLDANCGVAKAFVCQGIPLTPPPPPTPPTRPSPPLLPYHGYVLHPARPLKTWHEAKAACEGAGGMLAAVQTLAQHEALVALTTALAASPAGIAKGKFWIGGFAPLGGGGAWYWTAGGEAKAPMLGFDRWARGEPSSAEAVGDVTEMSPRCRRDVRANRC